MLQFTCDLSAPSVPLNHVWSHTIGSNHARMGLRADWQEQMRRVREELGVRYVRFHGILDDDMSVLLDEQDQRIYGFRNVDILFDFLLGIGMKPFVELSFMPSTLASGDQTVFNYHANVTPPRDPAAWDALIDLLVRHCVERYGLAEVRTWFFEVWNEPNLEAFWTGGQAGYFDLYKHTATTLKAIEARLRVGGPATADDADASERRPGAAPPGGVGTAGRSADLAPRGPTRHRGVRPVGARRRRSDADVLTARTSRWRADLSTPARPTSARIAGRARHAGIAAIVLGCERPVIPSHGRPIRSHLRCPRAPRPCAAAPNRNKDRNEACAVLTGLGIADFRT